MERYEASPKRPEDLPDFLQERILGNAHLGGLPDALAAHSGAVAVVARIDPAADLPPGVSAAGVPPLYVLGSGDESGWQKMLRDGPVKAVQIDRIEGHAGSESSRSVMDAADRYYRVIPAP